MTIIILCKSKVTLPWWKCISMREPHLCTALLQLDKSSVQNHTVRHWAVLFSSGAMIFSIVSGGINKKKAVTPHMASISIRRDLFAYELTDLGSDFQERKLQYRHIKASRCKYWLPCLNIKTLLWQQHHAVPHENFSKSFFNDCFLKIVSNSFYWY